MQNFEDIISFIYQSFLKKDEQLEIPKVLGEASLIDIDIVKRTARTIRRVGIITVAREYSSNVETLPDQQLLSWTVGRRALLDDNQQTFEWLHKGWILKEVRFKHDGRSVERIQYRIGYLLYVYLLNKQKDEYQDFTNQVTLYQLNAAQKMERITYLHDERLLQLKDLALLLSSSLQWGLNDIGVQSIFPVNWSISKRISGLNFLLAFLMISSNKEIFDWKEIGSQYYPGIGGSKSFDAYKLEFLILLETISGQSPETLGMISSGQITSVYFAGDLEGTWSNFRAGPVHALTNISVSQDHYSTRATTLWLVENRAVLTRMSVEPYFLQETQSLIICVDGHLRSAHKHFIRELLLNSCINQTIFWSDYDEAGLQIAREMLQSLMGHAMRCKWICPDHSIITNWPEYQQRMESLLQYMKLEQEIVLGEAEDWRSWINH
ncbi:DUF2399 domain-containing protein [Paenibacillus sp. 19GGS1-52]|uniref:DUF2399 domain-containing protein n=1 Tax=Paenibacillus sp. 19GGS1-52 TaxID=2758563 RepID=UPI001EFA3F53|nr:DUF2399 domain-containing protein [Paenibacillus sp. 19GGS1-52]ULO06237.1 DUF2399 domain-containing protein [Paenibacillus sp. 19GGS1-52]